MPQAYMLRALLVQADMTFKLLRLSFFFFFFTLSTH